MFDQTRKRTARNLRTSESSRIVPRNKSARWFVPRNQVQIAYHTCLPISYLSPLQRIQNTAARMVTFTRKHDHISPILRSLHWLPVNSRITFKILLIVYKITHNLAPQYLQDLVSLRSSSSARPLRSSFSMQIIHGPRTKTRYGDRAFSCIAPTLWNKLPPHIQNAPSIDSFKTLLKTHLFTL